MATISVIPSLRRPSDTIAEPVIVVPFLRTPRRPQTSICGGRALRVELLRVAWEFQQHLARVFGITLDDGKRARDIPKVDAVRDNAVWSHAACRDPLDHTWKHRAIEARRIEGQLFLRELLLRNRGRMRREAEHADAARWRRDAHRFLQYARMAHRVVDEGRAAIHTALRQRLGQHLTLGVDHIVRIGAALDRQLESLIRLVTCAATANGSMMADDVSETPAGIV